MDRLIVGLDGTRLAVSLTGLALLYHIGLFTYRLTFDPLAKFPGPKLAAATSWYEFYYDWWCEGQYVFEIKKMHDKYGNFYLPGNYMDWTLTDPDQPRSNCTNQPGRIIHS